MMNFGTLGRCGCGDIGRRRAPFAGEPICKRCLPLRSSYLRVIDGAAQVMGQLTPAQRSARRKWLLGSRGHESTLATQQADMQEGVPNDTRQPPHRQAYTTGTEPSYL